MFDEFIIVFINASLIVYNFVIPHVFANNNIVSILLKHIVFSLYYFKILKKFLKNKSMNFLKYF